MKQVYFRAFVWRSGIVEITSGQTPRGAIKVVTFRSQRAALVGARAIGTVARHAYDGETLLVPGIPEAACDTDAIDALTLWVHRLSNTLARHLPARSYRVAVAA